MLRAAHVDAACQPGIGAGGFLNERLQPFVRLPRHERPCGHAVPPGTAKRSRRVPRVVEKPVQRELKELSPVIFAP
ncbi:hypothetical protein CTZ27_21520 [Streptomyces griseocarneus]|nr:hypothetical protein CTZ27_21520 [Streptomyces griseocarneus]